MLITPSTRLFGVLCAERARQDRGWLEHADDDSSTVVRVPQSLAVMDTVAAQEPGTRLVFVGLCGGLTGVGVGDVVAVSSSLALNGQRYASTLEAAGMPQVTNVQTASLLSGAYDHAALLARGQTVDLETGSVLGQASASGVHAAAVLVVSDLNREPGVFDSDVAGLASSLAAACTAALTADQWRRT